MDNSKLLKPVAGIALILAVSLVGCSSEPPSKPEPTVSPTATVEPSPFVEVAESPYEAMDVPADIPVALPFEPEDLTLEVGELFTNAPTVNIPELKVWVKEQVNDGWFLSSEQEDSGYYSARLLKDEKTMLVDAVMSEESPFTSVIVSG